MKLRILTVGWALLPLHCAAVCLLDSYDLWAEYSRSELVFLGRVVESATIEESTKYLDGANHTVTMLELYKGRPEDRITIFSENSSGRFPMEVGKKYLLFANKTLGRFTSDNCGNSVEIDAANSSILEKLKRRKMSREASNRKFNSLASLPGITLLAVQADSISIKDLEHKVHLPEEYSSGRTTEAFEGTSDAARYISAHERSWWRVMRAFVTGRPDYMNTIFSCTGWPSEDAGCAAGEQSARAHLKGLLSRFSEPEIKDLLFEYLDP